MFMSDEKKKPSTIIVAKLGKPQPEEHEKDAETDGDEGHKSAAEEIISAVHAKDPKALVEALKSFVEMCEEDHDEEESSESPEEESSEHESY